MKMGMKLILVVILVGSTLFISKFSSQAEEVRGVRDNTILIGTIMDMTGPVCDNTLPYTAAVRNYFKYINDKGGINGRKVKVLAEDDRYSIPMAIAAFKKLVSKDKILAVIGLCTPQTTALFSQIEKNKLPTIAYSGMLNMTTPFRRYIFIHDLSYREMIMMLIDYVMKDLKEKDARFAIATADTVWGKESIEASKEHLERYGLKLLDIEILPMTSVDASTEAMNLKRSKANYVFVLHAAPPAVAVLNSSKKLGYFPTFMAIGSNCHDVFIQRAKTAAKGMIGLWAFSSWYDDTPGIRKMREITLKYQPDAGTPSRNYSWGWVAAMIGAEGMKRAGKNLNGETFVNALESIKDFDTGDISGPVSFSSKSHRGAKFTMFVKADLEKGRFVPITGWKKSSE